MNTIEITDYPKEEWREIEGYNGKYLISNTGLVTSLKRKTPRLLTAFVNNKGYKRVALCKNGKARYFLVSRLVAAAFCPNPDPENATVVDHIDGNTLNNNAENLRWLSPSENVRKYYKKEREDRNDNPK